MPIIGKLAPRTLSARSNVIWLTYAWKDNEDGQIDYVIGSLRLQKLDVEYDRIRLVPGQRLWPQIDAAISDSKLSAWAIYATKESLNSEPCLEELATNSRIFSIWESRAAPRQGDLLAVLKIRDYSADSLAHRRSPEFLGHSVPQTAIA
jgi:hypothetical protein